MDNSGQSRRRCGAASSTGGNGGYDVRHYHLDLSWQPDSKLLTGSETILVTATQALSSFDLDLRGFTVRV